MSHLIIEQGADVGKEVTVPRAGMKFGRSPANDLVLDDAPLMLFQGRFFFKSDGTLWVTDFSVEEKSRIAGVPVDEQQLKVGDLVEVGSTAFRVISTRMEEKEEVAAVVEAPAAEEIDLGFKPAKKMVKPGGTAPVKARTASPTYRVLQVVVIVLLLLLVVVGATEYMRSRASVAGRGVFMQGVFLNYEYVKGDAGNLFRYALSVTPQGVATLSVDDVRSRHFSKTSQLTPEVIKQFAQQVESSGFFSITGDRIGEVTDTFDQYDLVLACNGKFNHVRVVNRELPVDMRQIVATLEKFAFNALDVSLTLTIEDDKLIEYAQEAYRLAEDRYRERETAYGNLAAAILHLKEAINYLEPLEPKPEPYEQSVNLMARARGEQDRLYAEYMFDADRAMRTGDWVEAQSKLRILIQIISDRSDERYGTISEKMLEVEDKLR